MHSVNNHFIISQIVGDIAVVNPQASVFTKVGLAVSDMFEFLHYAFAYVAQFGGYKSEVILQAEMRGHLRAVVQVFFEESPQSKEIVKKTVESFKAAVLGHNMVAIKNPDLIVSRKKMFSLFIETLRVLSTARKNPIPSLDDKSFERLTDLVQSEFGIKKQIAVKPIVDPLKALSEVKVKKEKSTAAPAIVLEKKEPKQIGATSPMQKMAWIAAGCALSALSCYLWINYTTGLPEGNLDLVLAGATGSLTKAGCLFSPGRPTALLPSLDSSSILFLGSSSISSVVLISALHEFFAKSKKLFIERTEQCTIPDETQKLWDRCQSDGWKASHPQQCKMLEETWALNDLEREARCKMSLGLGPLVTVGNFNNGLPLPGSDSSVENRRLTDEESIEFCSVLKEAFQYPEEAPTLEQFYERRNKNFNRQGKIDFPLNPQEESLKDVHESIGAICPSKAAAKVIYKKRKKIS